jgi:hypothetical protein
VHPRESVAGALGTGERGGSGVGVRGAANTVTPTPEGTQRSRGERRISWQDGYDGPWGVPTLRKRALSNPVLYPEPPRTLAS